jgi:hypothetical protein
MGIAVMPELALLTVRRRHPRPRAAHTARARRGRPRGQGQVQSRRCRRAPREHQDDRATHGRLRQAQRSLTRTAGRQGTGRRRVLTTLREAEVAMCHGSMARDGALRPRARGQIRGQIGGQVDTTQSNSNGSTEPNEDSDQRDLPGCGPGRRRAGDVRASWRRVFGARSDQSAGSTLRASRPQSGLRPTAEEIGPRAGKLDPSLQIPIYHLLQGISPHIGPPFRGCRSGTGQNRAFQTPGSRPERPRGHGRRRLLLAQRKQAPRSCLWRRAGSSARSGRHPLSRFDATLDRRRLRCSVGRSENQRLRKSALRRFPKRQNQGPPAGGGTGSSRGQPVEPLLECV